MYKASNKVNSRTIDKNRRTWLDTTLSALLILFTLLSLRYQYFLSRHIEWGDESETIVAAKMMAAGQSLYSEIFNHHGPLTFLPGVLMELIGDFGVQGHRIPIMLLQAVALASIYFSPIFKNRPVKIACTFIAATIMIFYLPEFFGHTYTYQTITGLLIFICLFLYTFPAIIEPSLLSPSRVFVGNLLISCLPFLAFPYLPIALILFIASLKRIHLKHAIMGMLSGFCINFLFLYACGSIPGYLAFHIYMNATILPPYITGAAWPQLVLKALTTAIDNFSQYLYLTIITVGLAILASQEKKFPWRAILLALGIGSLLIRGGDFHGLPYYYALIAFSTLPVLWFKGFSNQAKHIALAFISLCIIKASILLPGERLKFSIHRIHPETEFSRLVKKYTNEGDKIIVYTFQNYQYIASKRLPASGNFFYFPWQKDYNQNPIFGIKIDTCKEISNYRPKIMLIDKWIFYISPPWETYAKCVQKIVDENYLQIPGRPYYIRKDIPAVETGTQ